MSGKFASLILGLLVLSCAPALLAQVNFASISGKVTDPSTAAVANAKVTIQAKETGAVRSLTTNNEGLFEAGSLLPGAYTVKVEASGFAEFNSEVTLEVEIGRAHV